MGHSVTLADTLGAWAKTDGYRQEIANTINAIADAGLAIVEVFGRNPQPYRQGDRAVEGRAIRSQADIAAKANAVLMDALAGTLVSAGALGRSNAAIFFHNSAPLCATFAPLDGASEIDANMPVGTIFSLLPAVFGVERAEIPSFLQPGARQVASGYIVSGPRTVLALTVGAGTQCYILDRQSATFQLMDPMVEMPMQSPTLTVNAGDDRHWDNALRRYAGDWLTKNGESNETGFQLCRSTSLAADCHRVLHQGGIQIYPAEARECGAIGRPNLVFEANPIARLIEQAGGAASTGAERILDIAPTDLRQQTPLIFGSHENVARFERYCAEADTDGACTPLFVHRGLFLA